MSSGKFVFPKIAQSECIFYNAEDIKGVNTKVTKTGSVRIFVGYTNTWDADIVWEELTTNEQLGQEHTFNTIGQYIYWKAIGEVGSSISLIKMQMVR